MPQLNVITRHSPWTVSDTVARLSAVARARGLTVFSTINHQPFTDESHPEPQGATTVLLGKRVESLPPTLAMPALGALHFPLAAVAWSDAGQTTVSVLNAPGFAACWWGVAAADNPLWDMGEIVDVVINR